MTDSFGGYGSGGAPRADRRSRRLGSGAPPAVVNAVRLMIVRAAFGLVSIIVLFATKDDLKKRILAKTPSATDSTIDTALTVGAVAGILILIFYLFLARLVRQGVNWARIVTWVIAGLGILGAVTTFTQPEPPLSQILGLIVGVIDVAIVVLLAQGPSNSYFRRRR